MHELSLIAYTIIFFLFLYFFIYIMYNAFVYCFNNNLFIRILSFCR